MASIASPSIVTFDRLSSLKSYLLQQQPPNPSTGFPTQQHSSSSGSLPSHQNVLEICGSDINQQALFALSPLLNPNSHIDNNNPTTQAYDQQHPIVHHEKKHELCLSLEIINLILRKFKNQKIPKDHKAHHHLPSRLQPHVELEISKAIWTHWNTSLGLSSKLKATLKTLLESITASQSDPDHHPALQFFIHSIHHSLFVEKRSMAILCYILPLLKADHVLQSLKSHIPTAQDFLIITLNSIEDDKLASVAGQLALHWTTIIENWDLKRNPSSEKLDSKSHSDWLSITISILFSSQERKRQYLCQYYLVPLFKTRPECFNELSNQLLILKPLPLPGCSSSQISLEHLSGFIALARIDPHLGTREKGNPSDKHPQPSPLITDEWLEVCLKHPSVSLRSSALSIICQTKASTTALPIPHLQLLFKFFKWNFGEVDAELKQNISSSLNLLVTRLRDSTWASHKKLSELRITEQDLTQGKLNLNVQQTKHLHSLIDRNQSYLISIEHFVKNFINLCRSNFNICSPYRNQIASLRYLSVFLDAGIDPDYSSSIKMRDMTIKLTKTQRFPFEFKILTPHYIKSLVIALSSTYVDVRETSFSILQNSISLMSEIDQDDRLDPQIVNYAVQCINSRRESETCTATLLLRLIVEKNIVRGKRQVPDVLLPKSQSDQSSHLDNPLAIFLHGRLEDLENKVIAAELDTASACENHPTQGALMIMSELFKSLSQEMIDSLVLSGDLKIILNKSRQLVKRIWSFSKLVLCDFLSQKNITNSMGLFQEPTHEEVRARELVEQQDGINLSDEEDNPDDLEQAGGPRHKIILSSCWRSMKEASALLTQIVKVSISGSKGGNSNSTQHSLLNYDELMEIGDLFEKWLLNIRHRGAFSAIHNSYTSLCEIFCNLPQNSDLFKLPSLWLNTHISAITNQQLSTTRRSAGLPYCILSTCQALASSDLIQLRISLNSIMELTENHHTSPISQVHLLNTLKHLHMDSRVSSKVPLSLRFIERSFDFAIKSFVSLDWRVRNGALILFSGLVNRVFGTRPLALDRSYSLLSKRETVQDFFDRLPMLHSVLLKELRRSIAAGLHNIADAHLQSPLFAILSLFTLLQNPNSAIKAMDFVPLIRECLQSKVSKIRSIGADAMTGLVPSKEIPLLLCDLMAEASTSINYNKMHGLLLLIDRLIQVPAVINSEEISKIEASLVQVSETFISSRIPLLCKLGFLNIVENLEKRFEIHFNHEKWYQNLYDWQTIASHPKTPATNSYLTKTAMILLKRSPTVELVLSFLSHDLTVLKMSALDFIRSTECEEIISNQLIKSAIFDIARHSTNSTVRIQALSILAEGIINFTTSNDDWSIESILMDSQTTTIDFIRHILLVIGARNIFNISKETENKDYVDDWTFKLLKNISITSLENQSIETRLSITQSLIILLNFFNLLNLNNQLKIINLILTLIQDDDDQIRSKLIYGVSINQLILNNNNKQQQHHHNLFMISIPLFEFLSIRAHELCFTFGLERLMNYETIESELKQLKEPSSSLFITERLNLYKDELIEYDFFQNQINIKNFQPQVDDVDEDVNLIELKSLLSNQILFNFNRLLKALKDENLNDFKTHHNNNNNDLINSTNNNMISHHRSWILLSLRLMSIYNILKSQFEWVFTIEQINDLNQIKIQLNDDIYFDWL